MRSAIGRLALILTATAIGAFPEAGRRATAERLTVVLDKENLPYSSRRGSPPGLDAEVAQALAQVVGVELAIRWANTLEEGWLSFLLARAEAADFAVGAPIEPRSVEESGRVGDQVLYSQPYATARYVLVSRREERDLLAFSEVGREPLGVEAGSVAEHELWNQGYLLRRFGDQDRVLRTLVDGGLRYGVLWMNSGWLIHQEPAYVERLKVQPAPIDAAEMTWGLAVALAPGHGELVGRFNAAIGELSRQGAFARLFARYHVPFFEPEEGTSKP